MVVEMSKPWRELVDVPSGINTLCSPARVSTMLKVFGQPEGKLTTVCGGKDRVSAKLRPMIVTKDVGPFKLTGYDKFLAVLADVFYEFKQKHPEQYKDLSTAGCLCVRLVRGSNHQPSNHCWGTAIDLGFNKVVDNRGDGLCYAGLLDLYAIAKRYGLYWGAGFGREDAMHFEASDELIRKWGGEGL